MLRRISSVLAVVLLLLFSGGWLSAQTTVRVGVYDDNKPLVFRDSSGKWQGLCIDVIEHAAAREGWRLQYLSYPLPECLEALEKGDIDLLVAIAWSSERAAVYDFNTWTQTRALQSESDERRKVEEKLFQAQKMEAIAHDFNNLLTPILGYVDLLLDQLSPAENAREKLREIQRAGLRARDLVGQLLAFSRRQILELRVVDLNEAISESRALLRRTIRENIEIRYNLAAENSRVVADPTQFLQVLMNLAVNAQNAMPDGGVLTVETNNRRLEGDETDLPPDVAAGLFVQLVMRDTGGGMTAEIRARIFEPFFTTKEGGTGLGLAVVFGAVRQHRGFIEVASETAGGTSFSICLPATSEAASSVREKPPSVAGSVAGLELYVVEDDELVRELTVTLLREGGYRVRSASSAEQCLKELGEDERLVHLLVTDVIMPGMNGRQLYELLRGSHPDLRMLYLSGYGGEFIAQMGVQEEKVALLKKPFTDAELQAKVLEVLAERAPGSAGGGV